jgi:glucose-1-phosphate thymidylyltransferase
MSSNGKIKGIVLAGGYATRLYPATKTISKQLLPIYDKPMIYYPLSVLMLAGIREIMIISTPADLPFFERLLGDGNQIGLSFHYAEQLKPEGLAQAFIIAKEFIAGHPSCLILGDNLFYGHGLVDSIQNGADNQTGATIFAYWVSDPERYGVVVFDRDGRAKDIIEKPKSRISNWAITGLYFYDQQVSQIAASLKPSARGEYEITDLNRVYLEQGLLNVEKLGRGIAWLDTGTHKIACLEEIAYNMGYINREQLESIALSLKNSSYGDYLQKIVTEWEK